MYFFSRRLLFNKFKRKKERRLSCLSFSLPLSPPVKLFLTSRASRTIVNFAREVTSALYVYPEQVQRNFRPDLWPCPGAQWRARPLARNSRPFKSQTPFRGAAESIHSRSDAFVPRFLSRRAALVCVCAPPPPSLRTEFSPPPFFFFFLKFEL